MADRLFQDFAPVTDEQWREVVTKDLKGADFGKRLVSKTLDGLEIKPYYRRTDVPATADASPGQLPYRRGYRTDANDWLVREQIRETDLFAANARAVRALTTGAEELSILSYPFGVPLKTQHDVELFLKGIFIEMVAIHWMGGPFSAQLYAMVLNEADRRGVRFDELRGSVDNDPIMDAAAGWTTLEMGDWKNAAVPIVSHMLEHTPNMATLVIRGGVLERAGASVAQELAFSLSLLVEYLSGLKEEGFNLNEIVPRIEMRYAVGSHYFLEIAKLRAQRTLLAQVLQAFGIDGPRPHIHVDTTSCNKTLYDPYNNLLRGTTEAMAAAIGGVDSLSVAAFDQGYNSPDEFSAHIARNTETLLKEEAFLTRVVDPLGGSYYIETLTESLAKAAWELFQRTENEGGFIKAYQNGFIGKELERIREAKGQRTNGRRTPIVGTSVYPNLKETRLQDVRRPAKTGVLHDWTSVASDIEELRTALAGGRAIDNWDTEKPLPSTPLNPYRPAWPFEHLRLRMESHVAAGSAKPMVLLAQVGDAARRRARAGFALGFIGSGGYAVEDGTFSTVEELATAAQKAAAVVLCSSDEEYADWVKPTKAALAGKPLLVAGAPENADQLRSDGADQFIHVKSDVVKELQTLHSALGIAEEVKA